MSRAGIQRGKLPLWAGPPPPGPRRGCGPQGAPLWGGGGTRAKFLIILGPLDDLILVLVYPNQWFLHVDFFDSTFVFCMYPISLININSARPHCWHILQSVYIGWRGSIRISIMQSKTRYPLLSDLRVRDNVISTVVLKPLP